MGRRGRQGNCTSQNNNSIVDLVGKEENEYSFPNPNKTMIYVTSELSDTHKKTLKKEIMDKITEKLMEQLQGTFSQKVQDALKKYQASTHKILRKT
jgi:hypothetical protein